MTEVLFMVTLIFVAYVAYAALSNTGKSTPVSSQQPAAQESKTEMAAVKETAAASKSEPVAQAEEAVAEAKISPVAAEKTVNSLRDPKTGEVATIPANYRFAKRWIKEALVSEGLVDKVYKNGELDGATSAKVKQALDALKTMEKYQA